MHNTSVLSIIDYDDLEALEADVDRVESALARRLPPELQSMPRDQLIEATILPTRDEVRRRILAGDFKEILNVSA